MDSPQRRVRVVIVDDDALVRAALRLVLEGDSGVTVLGEGADGRSGYDAARSLRPDVVLMDLHMPGTDGVWATAQIAADCPDTKVLVLTAFDTDAMVAAALRAGATGFLLKDSAPEIIFRAVHAAADGQRAFSGSVLDRLVEAAVEATPQRRAFPETVTDRERQVALLVAQGLGNGEIAEELVVGASTVKTHVSALLDKFGVTNRVQLAVAVAECTVDDVPR
ncbi:response regulator transcription factor [Actinomyces naeslundii]|uniref:Response regulator receiver domain protein n=2 Tax=Actinomyces naeslundii TaxID=1655 RepID=J2ZTR4_ACTNH|nr:response regulator transcription factor [Actinomyces naeslundii]EJN86005.1 response regulator receiver domain protein [Actinomyces naeslundii str. Howell 279]OMG31063.1 DNA-binding response regulator [Actinomyces naeslundii]OMG31955.1 DNA-binding response regulator [Actinomyces naeslundii]OMG37290.1 DNA-binding response regulator [Actinomyces naeslundii]QQC19832.1 response regulator transcription factor [Actinomyces naeslundii]